MRSVRITDRAHCKRFALRIEAHGRACRHEPVPTRLQRVSGALVVFGVLALAGVFGVVRQRQDGRVRRMSGTEVVASPFAALGTMGTHATIVQFSAPVCAPCRAAKVIARDVASSVPGVTHIEVQAEQHMDLVSQFNILRTPTILVLDGAGRLSARISGVPRRDELLVALDDRRFEDL